MPTHFINLIQKENISRCNSGAINFQKLVEASPCVRLCVCVSVCALTHICNCKSYIIDVIENRDNLPHYTLRFGLITETSPMVWKIKITPPPIQMFKTGFTCDVSVNLLHFQKVSKTSTTSTACSRIYFLHAYPIPPTEPLLPLSITITTLIIQPILRNHHQYLGVLQ
ncbi:hypothetical protein CDL12_22953 [Handroanthus impetiginosus]|uniref:Uncharacterized protein n=1 Tax=Handroanthus impetiginosus TaxID=429701 RepID=A0A2G9GGU0_9LAMI|nr:hypothetical protein CDL12_22953 [Handroanthus impetiginosus]